MTLMTGGCLTFLALRQAQDDSNGGRKFNVLTLRQAQDDINDGRVFNVFNASRGSG